MKNRLIVVIVLTVLCFVFSVPSAEAWWIFGRSDKEAKKDTATAVQMQPKELQMQQTGASIPLSGNLPGIYVPTTKEGEGELLRDMEIDRIEMLKKLLIKLYKFNNNLSELFKNDHWKYFTREELITPGTETNTIRRQMKHDFALLNWKYASLIYVFSGLFDCYFEHPDGTPFEPGDTKSWLWGDDYSWTRDIDEGDPLDMTGEEVVAWVQECRRHTSCVNNIPIMKWNIWYKEYVIDRLTDMLTRPDSTPLTLSGLSWSSAPQRYSDNFAAFRDMWKRVYENPRLFNEPMPTE